MHGRAPERLLQGSRRIVAFVTSLSDRDELPDDRFVDLREPLAVQEWPGLPETVAVSFVVLGAMAPGLSSTATEYDYGLFPSFFWFLMFRPTGADIRELANDPVPFFAGLPDIACS